VLGDARPAAGGFDQPGAGPEEVGAGHGGAGDADAAVAGAFHRDGSLLVSDEQNGAIYRISRQ
jgi:glucose/arabinose dehydrogenase